MEVTSAIHIWLFRIGEEGAGMGISAWIKTTHMYSCDPLAARLIFVNEGFIQLNARHFKLDTAGLSF